MFMHWARFQAKGGRPYKFVTSKPNNAKSDIWKKIEDGEVSLLQKTS